MNNNIPTFTPPAPTFTPPANANRGGTSCYYHRNEQAVARCASCGKPLCEDCVDTYQVNDGEYAGKALCYDCCRTLVAENVKELKKQRAKIIAMYIFTIIGMIFGAIIGAAMLEGSDAPGILIVVAAFVGGCLWTFILNLLRIVGGAFKAMFEDFSIGTFIGCFIGAIIGFVKAVIISVVGTIRKLFTYTKHLIKTSGFIKSDSNALQQMADYMEYTVVRSQNVGVDLATLMNQNSQFANNTYAQNVAANGEANAEASIRNCVTSINENGEIIRSFVA